MTIVTIGLLTSACERLNRPGPGPPPRLPVPNTPHPLRRAGCSRSQSSERSRHGRLHRAPPGGRTWSDAMRARSHMAAAPSALRCTAVSRRGHRSRVGVQLPAAAQRRLGPASGVCPKNGRVGVPQRRRGTGMSRSPPTSTSGSSAKTRRAPRTSLSRSCGGLSSAGRSSSAWHSVGPRIAPPARTRVHRRYRRTWKPSGNLGTSHRYGLDAGSGAADLYSAGAHGDSPARLLGWQDLIVVSASAASADPQLRTTAAGMGKTSKVPTPWMTAGRIARSCAPAPRRRLRCWRCRRCQPGRRPARRRRRSRRREVLPVGEVRLHG